MKEAVRQLCGDHNTGRIIVEDPLLDADDMPARLGMTLKGEGELLINKEFKILAILKQREEREKQADTSNLLYKI